MLKKNKLPCIPSKPCKCLPNINLEKKLLQNTNLSCHCLSLILGTILGDGSLKIYKSYKNAFIQIKHSIVQQDYLNWKLELLKEISNSESVQICKPTGYSKNTKLLFQSKAATELTIIHNQTYHNNKIDIKRKWLNHLTPLSLMVWWMDDGSIIGGGRKGIFCTDGLTKEGVEILSNYLLVVWKIENNITLRNKEKNQYRISLNTSNLKLFLKIIMPYVTVPSMLYKFAIRYNDERMQQRWISEMKENLPEEMVPYIEKVYKIQSENDIVHDDNNES